MAYSKLRVSIAFRGKEHFFAMSASPAAVLETSRAPAVEIDFVFASSNRICLKVFDLYSNSHQRNISDNISKLSND